MKIQVFTAIGTFEGEAVSTFETGEYEKVIALGAASEIEVSSAVCLRDVMIFAAGKTAHKKYVLIPREAILAATEAAEGQPLGGVVF